MADTEAPARPSWAGPATAGGFTPPTVVPAPASTSEHRAPKGARESRTPAVDNLGSKVSRRRPRRVVTVALSILTTLLVISAGLMLWKAFTTESIEAPLPAKEFEKAAGETVVGPVGDEPVDVGERTMTTADMEPNTLFIPQLGVYMPVESDDSFVPSQYAGFNTLKVPKDPSHGVRFAGGAPMYGGQAGVTMIASHVSTSTGWGALRYLYQLTGGEMLYTKDDAGQLQSWQMTAMRVEDHTAFPQEYWSPEGERLLVVTTCGGAVNSKRLFTQNIFAVAVPVDPLPKSDAQILAEQAVQAVSELALQRRAEAAQTALDAGTEEPEGTETDENE